MNSRTRSGLAILSLLAATLIASPCARAQGIRCGAGQDLIVQALERITPQSGNDAFEDALQLLKSAVAECPELGDAWYYRSLVEKRLGHDALAKYAMDKAHFNGSEALDQDLNPLVLSTPASRGIEAEGTETPVPVAPPAKPGPVQQKWALVIGIGHFTDTQIPQLNYTGADATAFATALKDPSIGAFPADNVHVLTDDQATTKNIKEQLNWIARHAEPNDLVVIYVATHGTPRTTDTAGGANYLITYDTEVYSGG
ncbi:MAG: caspase family protein, partial [Terracidiphilus sp.]